MPAPTAAMAITLATAVEWRSSSPLSSAMEWAAPWRPPTSRAASQATAASASGVGQRRDEKWRGPASMTNPPVMRTMSSTSRAPVPSRTRMELNLTRRPEGLRLLEDREEARILLLPLRRQRPLFLQRLVELRPEELALHPAVDDVPGEHGVAGAVAEYEKVRVDACLRHGGAPVAAVALRGLDRGSDAAVAEGQQGL